MKKLLAVVAVSVLALSSVAFAGGGGHSGKGGGHSGGHSHSGGGHGRVYGRNIGYGNRYVTYDSRVMVVRPVIVESYSYSQPYYGGGSSFGYEGNLGGVIGTAIGGMVHYNKYVR